MYFDDGMHLLSWLRTRVVISRLVRERVIGASVQTLVLLLSGAACTALDLHALPVVVHVVNKRPWID